MRCPTGLITMVVVVVVSSMVIVVAMMTTHHTSQSHTYESTNTPMYCCCCDVDATRRDRGHACLFDLVVICFAGYTHQNEEKYD